MADGQPEGLKILVATAGDAGKRVDAWLAATLTGLSRVKVQRLIDEGAVTADGRPVRARDTVKEGLTVTVARAAQAAAPRVLAATAMALDIVYEDGDIVVVNKPAGVAVHPGAGDTGPTLVEGLLAHVGGRLGQSVTVGHDDPLADVRPGIVHRLDKDTSGVLVCARTDVAHAALARQFHDKTDLLREYQALLDGVMPVPEITRESWLGRDRGDRTRYTSMEADDHRRLEATRPSAARAWRYAKSVFRREKEYRGRVTLARVRLYTGRTHQIRVHARDLKLGVLGDAVYHRPVNLPAFFGVEARDKVATLGRQMLHAARLGFVHPTTGKPLLFEVPPPEDFSEIMRLLEG